MKKRLPAVLVLSFLLPALLAPPAHASCAGFQGSLKQRLAGYDTVFVGTVVDTAADGRLATVDVESVWRGQVPPTAVVAGGAVDGNAITSVDRTYETGTRYLFTPHAFADGRYRDNACTDTQEWTPKIEKLRPQGAAPAGGDGRAADQAPSEESAAPAGDDTGRGLGGVAVAALIAAGGFGVVVLVWSRRHLRPQPGPSVGDAVS